MTQEQLQAILVKVQGDARLQQLLHDATASDDATVADIAEQVGFALPTNQNPSVHLTGDDLETMAGGAMTGPVGSAAFTACGCPLH